jgi:hypothetical protein
VSVTLGLGLAAYGVAGSYQTVSGLAERRGVPLALLVPVGIDGGLIGVVVLDLVLSWIGQPIGWLRQFARVLTVGTVAANAAAGWPDLVSAGLHVAAPLMLLAMVEAGRTVLLRRINSPDGRVIASGCPVGAGAVADVADVAAHGAVADRQPARTDRLPDAMASLCGPAKSGCPRLQCAARGPVGPRPSGPICLAGPPNFWRTSWT